LPTLVSDVNKTKGTAGSSRQAVESRVLFITEHARDVESLEKELEVLGYSLEVKQVASFDDFKESLKDCSPDVVLVELNLPGFDGVKALDYLKDSMPNIPLVVISDHDDGEPDHLTIREVNRLPEYIARALPRDNESLSPVEIVGEDIPIPELGEVSLDLENSSGTGFVIIEAGSNRPLHVNRAFAEMTGYSPDELMTFKSILQLTMPDDVAVFARSLESTSLDQSNARNLVVRIARRDGLIAQLKIAAKPYDRNNRKRIAMIVHDTAETSESKPGHRNEMVDGKSKRFWTVVENAASFAVFDIDEEGKVRSWNPGAEQFTGYLGNEILGREFSTFLTGDDEARYEVTSFIDGASSTERMERETWISRKDGGRFRAELILTRLFDVTGAPAGFSAFVKEHHGDVISQERLQEREAQLHSLASHLQKAREEEKTLIARQLHDEFGQMLTALRMDLSILGSMISRTVSEPFGRGSILEKISSVSEILEKAIKTAREMITELRPAVLDELGLLTAIKWQVLEFENRTGISCHITELQQGEIFDPTVSTTTFRILQEALDNVMRHSAATEVFISLKAAGSNLVLEVADNGKGIEADKLNAPTSIGIIGMRERVLALGGKLDVHGEPGRGTTLTVSIPRVMHNAL
jgi:PAS domain S-box-containing protein